MKVFSISILGDQARFPCAEGDPLLRGALRSGVGLPYECNSGGCGTCAFELIAGEVSELWANAPGLSPHARASGKRLACQCVPTSDCVIKIRQKPEYIPPVSPKRRTARLESVRALTGDMSEFRFKSDDAAEFRPGQYTLLNIEGDGDVRAYSMSNVANHAGEWEFIIKRVPGGKLTGTLFGEMKSGSRVVIDGPYGVAYLRPESTKDIICIAGGAGLSPMMSVVRGAITEKSLAARDITLFYGGRTPGDICTPLLVDADPAVRQRVRCVNAVSEPQSDETAWSGERGFIHQVAERALGERMGQFEFYFSGPAPMVDAVQRMLLVDKKVPSSQLHFDRFF